MANANLSVECLEESLPASYRGGWPPDFSALSSLGFDSVEVTKHCAIARQVQSRDLSGRPHLFATVELWKDKIVLRYSCPPESEKSLRSMHARLLLLRILRLVGGYGLDAGKSAEFFLPAFEQAAQVAAEPYESIFKRLEEAKAARDEAISKNTRLSRTAEESAAIIFQLERRLLSSWQRVEVLSAVPDSALCELVREWLAAHRGRFDAAKFSREHAVPPSRAEEGLEMLLKSGEISRIGHDAFFSSRPVQARVFSAWRKESAMQSVGSKIMRAVAALRNAIHGKLGRDSCPHGRSEL